MGVSNERVLPLESSHPLAVWIFACHSSIPHFYWEWGLPVVC